MANPPNISGKTVTPSQSSLPYIYRALGHDDWVNRPSPQSSPVTISKRSVMIEFADRHEFALGNSLKWPAVLSGVTVTTVVTIFPLTPGSGLGGPGQKHNGTKGPGLRHIAPLETREHPEVPKR